jgi:hypothetical protein
VPAWDAPPLFVWGVFAIMVIGALLPLRIETREDYFVITMGAGVATAVLGPSALVLAWGAIVVAAPVLVAWNLLLARRHEVRNERSGARPQEPMRRQDHGLTAGVRAIVWNGTTALSASVGVLMGAFVYVVVLGRSFPMPLTTTDEMVAASVVVLVWAIGSTSVRIIVLRLVTGSFAVILNSLDPFDSPLTPYLLPIFGGFPIVVACVALYRPSDPGPTLLFLLWCFPLYAATAFDSHRRRLALELRRDVAA